MDTVRITIKMRAKLTPKNSPFVSFGYSKNGFRQAWLNGKEYYTEYGLYFPTVSYMERPNGKKGSGFSYDLRIEFSAPKIVFGDNLHEITEDDYSKLRTTLLSRLHLMGFDFISPEDINNATVSRLDVCKNVIFSSRAAMIMVINALKKANLGGEFTPFEKSYLGGGYAIGFSLKNEEISVYDKGEDLRRARKSKSKARDEDAFFEGGIKGEWKNGSVLRIEVKMNNAGTIRRRLKSVGLEVSSESITLSSIFKGNIWKLLLNNRFRQIYAKIPIVELDGESVEQTFLSIIKEEQGKRGGFRRSLERLGTHALLEYSNLSVAEIEGIIESSFGRSNKYKFHKARAAPIDGQQLKSLIMLRRAVEDFKPLTEADISVLS